MSEEKWVYTEESGSKTESLYCGDYLHFAANVFYEIA